MSQTVGTPGGPVEITLTRPPTGNHTEVHLGEATGPLMGWTMRGRDGWHVFTDSQGGESRHLGVEGSRAEAIRVVVERSPIR